MSGAPRIGYVAKKFPRFSETFIVNEILGLEEHGADVTVLSRRYPDEGRFHPSVARLRNAARYLSEGRSDALAQAIQQYGAEIDDCLDRIPGALRWLRRFPIQQPLGVLAEALVAVALARRLGLEHLHAHFATDATTVACLANQLGAIPYSFTAHAKDLYRDAVSPELFAEKLDRARFMVTVCEANVEHVRANLAPRSRTPVLRLYNGIDLRYFTPAAESAPGDPVILCVGRLVPKKGFEVLVEASALLRDRGARFRTVIVGDGELASDLRARVAARGLGERVHFTGALPQPEVRDWMRRAAIGTLPCVVDPEGNRDALPTTLLESMACELPLVSTPVGGVPEIVADGETGRLVPPGDAPALAAALGEFLERPSEARRLGAAGRRRAEELFDVRVNTGRLLALFAASGRGAALAEARAR